MTIGYTIDVMKQAEIQQIMNIGGSVREDHFCYLIGDASDGAYLGHTFSLQVSYYHYHKANPAN